jgi:hypothetical protein
MEHTGLNLCFRLHQNLPQLIEAERNDCPVCKQIFAQIWTVLHLLLSPIFSTWIICQPLEETLKFTFVSERGVTADLIDFKVLAFEYEESDNAPEIMAHLNVVESYIMTKMTDEPFDNTIPDLYPSRFRE